MCGRFVADIPASELAKIFKLVESQTQLKPRYNVAPTQSVAVIRNANDHNILSQMKWGLIPSWSKDTKIASHTINARSETVAEKPAFRHAIKYQRCIIPSSGFYEWSHTEHHKEPHYIFMSDRSIMSFAGIWETWKAPDESIIETFSILTTTANKLIETLHDRMPVIIQAEDFDIWLNKNMHDPHQLEQLYQPLMPELMSLYKVSDLVNSPRNDSPRCIEPVLS
jgi:putative SOS response-associated peptidase YedK